MEGNQNRRAGTYIKQPTGYRAFIPSPLPPDPPVALSGALQVQLSRADRAVGRLDGSVEILPNPDLFIFMYVRKEAVLSSQIEGTQSSLTDLLAAEAELTGNRAAAGDVGEVINYVGAMNHGLSRLAELPISVRLIKEIHERLMRGVRGSHLTPGETRTTQNWIGPGECSLADATFVPPPPHQVATLLGDLERFLHTQDELPMLIKIGLAHTQFETIHPFLDGNGRVGRHLISFLLTEKRVLLKPVLYLSHYFKRYRQEYYDRLQAVRDHGDWESWLMFFLKGVEEVSNEAIETSRRILSLREEHRASVTAHFGRAAGKGHLVLEQLYLRPIVSVADVREITGTTYAAANQLVARFVECGILMEITGFARNRLFRHEPYVRLFT